MSNCWEKIIKEGNLRYKWDLLKGKKQDSLNEDKKPIQGLVFKSKDFDCKISEIFGFKPSEVHGLEDLNEVSILKIVRAIMKAMHKHGIEFVIVLDYLKIDISKTKVFIRLIDLLRSYPGLPNSIEVFGYFYEEKSGWVFSCENFQNITSQEELSKLCFGLRKEKKIELIKYLEKLHQKLEKQKQSKELESTPKDKILVVDKNRLNQKSKKDKNIIINENSQKSHSLKPNISIKRVNLPIVNTYRVKRFKNPKIKNFNTLTSVNLIKIQLITLPKIELKNFYGGLPTLINSYPCQFH